MESKLILLTCLLTGSVLSRASPLFPPEELLIHNNHDQSDTLSRADGDYRLPNVTKPLHYVIKLNPHLKEGNFTFTGENAITLQVLQPTNTITLHSKEQTIAEDRTTLSSTLGFHSVTDHAYDKVRDFLTITTQETLPVGAYILTLHYTGILRDDMIGFYKSSYTNAANETIWIATSKFEPTHARYAFPCYDEPALKITVNIWLKREESQHSLANMPLLAEQPDSTDGKTWSIFQTNPLISTYLIAFIVSDFANITTPDHTFGVWARSSAIGTAQYAFDIGRLALKSLQNYTGIFYTLDKMDQIAIPDFASGAMENWGLVTYRERYLLFEDGVSTTSDKQNVATIISHEFAHQWFGNLVSPEWWTYLWLNEGFATYFEYFIPAQLEPKWRLDEQFPVSEIQASAFAADGLTTSHPMNADVEIITEIKGIFDSISYAKAASVIRMLEHIVTTPVFKAALKKYLNANDFNCGTSDRLWKSFQEVVDDEGQSFEVKEVMDTWVTQAGFPVVTVTRDYDTGSAVLSQERFFLKKADANDSAVYWWVPINWGTASELDYSVTAATAWIPANKSITLNFPSADEWVLLNKQQTGFYRVNYDQTNWNLLLSYLNGPNYTQISPVNRAQLIDDAFNLARGGYLDYATALNVTKYLAQETDYIPWYSAFNGFTYINRLLAQTSSYNNFKLDSDYRQKGGLTLLNTHIPLNNPAVNRHPDTTYDLNSNNGHLVRDMINNIKYIAFERSHRLLTFAFDTETYLSSLLVKVLDTVGYEERDTDEHVQKFLRANALTWSCNLGQEVCLQFAREKLLSWLVEGNEKAITPNLKSVVYCAGIRTANSTIWNLMWKKYLATDLSSEQILILRGLGCSSDTDILNNYMALATTVGSGIRAQDSSTAFTSVYTYGSAQNIEPALNYIIDNTKAIIEYYGGTSTVETLLSGIGLRITTTSQLEKLQAFATAQAALLGTSAKTGISNAQDNLAWIEAYAPIVETWLTGPLDSGNGSGSNAIVSNALLAVLVVHLLQRI